MVPYAGFWRRFVAALIDGILLQVVLSIVGGILGVGIGAGLGGFGAMGQSDEINAAGLAAVGTIYLVAFVGQWLYFALMESSGLQATVGKLAMGVVVTDQSGNRISFGRATGRYFGKILSGIILMIGYIMAAFTERKQGLHDMIAGTLVYKTRDPSSVRSTAGVFD